MQPAAVLLVDTDARRATALTEELSRAGIRARAIGPEEAASTLDGSPFDAVVVTASSLGATVAQEVEEWSGRWPDVSIVVLTEKDSMSLAVRVIRAGAVDCLPVDADPAELAHAVRKATATSERTAETPGSATPARGRLLGESRVMRKVHGLVAKVAPTEATVLVRGESGTGKELVARALHDGSPRASGPFVKIHCAALPDALLESELFGYEKGAFTGAAARKPGRVELAEGGTLFLDEIGDVTPAFQVKLLRLLQDREFERLGGTHGLRANVRFVAATHRDLESMIQRGEFRMDLFYRLQVVSLWLPPLRARREDLPLLARELCRASASQARRPVKLTDEAIDALKNERWPGNVRQLQNLIERLVVLADGPEIRAEDVARELSDSGPFPTGTGTAITRGTATSDVGPLSAEVHEAERRALSRALKKTNGNRLLAAKILGVSRRTLYYKLAEHGLG
jgi:two-component system, NtrC family, response regulator AtoC